MRILIASQINMFHKTRAFKLDRYQIFLQRLGSAPFKPFKMFYDSCGVVLFSIGCDNVSFIGFYNFLHTELHTCSHAIASQSSYVLLHMYLVDTRNYLSPRKCLTFTLALIIPHLQQHFCGRPYIYRHHQPKRRRSGCRQREARLLV